VELVNVGLLGKGAISVAKAFPAVGSGTLTPSLIRHVTASSLGLDDMHRDLGWCK
jgi:hypothetical protein